MEAQNKYKGGFQGFFNQKGGVEVIPRRVLMKKIGRWLLRNLAFSFFAYTFWDSGFVRLVTYVYSPFALLYLTFLLFINRFVSNKMKASSMGRGQKEPQPSRDEEGTVDTDYEEVD